MFHQRYMEEAHKDPEVVPTFNTRDWPNTLETAEEYIRGCSLVDGQPLNYGLRINGREYFTHNEEMIARG